MGVEQIMRGIALAGLLQLHDIDQQFREGVAGHGAVGAALHLEIEEQPPLPTRIDIGFSEPSF
jgi:hypothetical protein